MKRQIKLRPIRVTVEEYEKIEASIKWAFKRKIYDFLRRKLGIVTSKAVKNATADLIDAIRRGHVTYKDGVFSGKFSATISKELRDLGAKFSRGKFRLEAKEIPHAVRVSIKSADTAYQAQLAAIDKHLSDFDSQDFVKTIEVEEYLSAALSKTENDFQRSIKGITVSPKLMAPERRRIAKEWRNNMDLWIQNFAEKHIKELRDEIAQNVHAGNRYESMTKTIASSYGVTERKAKFLARQETNLLMGKYKEARYASAGVRRYVWQCVNGSPLHPVRPAHQKLNGSTQSFANPPLTTEPSQPARYNNPGEDFNCRCYARPIVEKYSS